MWKKLLVTLFAAVLLPEYLIAQRTPPGQSPDNVVTLLSAQSAELMEVRGKSLRKVVGPARFYHNSTYLICDTAYWYVEDEIIKAIGHVKIVQNQTKLTSETLDYIVQEDMAKFRGLVQLEDKDKNVLRTRYMDYNTRDSIAIFQDGGAMKSADGQVIESKFGSYESKIKTFTFMDNVQMYTDTTLIRTSRLVYDSNTNVATFGYGTDVWHDDNMMSAGDGWFNRGKDWFFFRKNVHIMTPDREGWSDSLLYKRPINEVEMLGNAQVLDTVRSVRAMAGRIFYQDTLVRVTMTRRPVIITVTEEKDTVYFGADTLVHRTIPRCEVDSMAVVLANKRMSDLAGDPVMEYRRKAAEAAAKAAEEAAMNDPNRPPDIPGMRAAQAGADAVNKAAGKTPDKDTGKDSGGKSGKQSGKTGKKSAKEKMAEAPSVIPGLTGNLSPADTTAALADTTATLGDTTSVAQKMADQVGHDEVVVDTLAAPSDTLAAPLDTLAAPSDTLAAPADTLPPAPKDSTKIDFVWAWSRVKLFREDTQLACDSLAYNGLDSLVRIYKEPFVFQEKTRQYTADSIYVVLRGNAIEKANLMSNAFITIQEDTVYYDQIKGAEMMAYFDTTGALRRFDGLGGTTALFYLQENDVIATANKVDAKMLSANFIQGEIDRLLYFDSAKNDAYPVVQLPAEAQRLKGFNWSPERRPTGLADMTEMTPRPTERASYAAHEKPDFPQSEIYFKGYMKQVLRDLADRKNRPRRPRSSSSQKDDILPPSDTLQAPSDTLTAAGDSLGAQSDSLGTARDSLGTVRDSLGTQSDSLGVVGPTDPKVLKQQEKERKKAEKERIKAEKQAAREAHWAELDKRDAEKAEAKKQKKLDKKRKHTLKALRREAARAAKEKALYERYLKYYQRKAAKTNKKN